MLQGWTWIHTPGHSPGQVALYRESDGTLISADAFITVRQDSFYKVLIQKEEINGPPRYFTIDWKAAWDSVKNLEALQPELVVPGHGQFMEGEELRKGLKNLVENFEKLAIPDYGKYVPKDLPDQ
jgi:glyoxylase-like metal-dependent hydrolase (beta-lactamase superfamily II)